MSYKDRTKVVKEGGTGVQSHTAYGVVAGGTTSTGDVQNAGAGASSEFLTSQDAGALPAWVPQPTIWENLASDPVSPSNGDVWFNTSSNTFKGATVISATAWTTKANYPLTTNQLPTGAGNPEDALGGSGKSPYTQTYRYSLSGDSWTAKTSMNNVHLNGGSAGADGSDVLAYGSGFSKTAERYDGGANTWTNKASMSVNCALFGTSGEAATAFRIAGSTSPAVGTNTTELYDGTGDSWTSKANYSLTIIWLGGAGAGGGDAVGFGGNLSSNSYLWDSSGNSWSATGSLAVARYSMGMSGTVSDAFSIGGDNTSPSTTTQRYQSATWSSIASLNTGTKGCGSSSFASGINLALKWGGSSPGGNTNKTELLTSSTTTIITFTVT